MTVAPEEPALSRAPRMILYFDIDIRLFFTISNEFEAEVELEVEAEVEAD